MGGRGNLGNRNTTVTAPQKVTEAEWNAKVDAYINKMIDNSQIKEGKPTKDAAAIFETEFRRVVRDIEKGYDYTQLTNLHGSNDEYIRSKRTLQGIQYRINRQAQESKFDFRHSIINNEQFNNEIKALKIIQSTLNEINKEKKF